MIAQPHRRDSAPARSRAALLLICGGAALLGTQVLRPSQAWPEHAPMAGAGLAMLCGLPAIFAAGATRRNGLGLTGVQWALLALCAMMQLAVAARAWFAGWPSAGMGTAVSQTFALWVFSGSLVAARLAPRKSPLVLSWGLVGATAMLGAYAMAQRWHFYPAQLARLSEEFGPSPNPVQMGILHHLRIGRVAGPFGDPNILALACAMGMAPSILAVAGVLRIRPGRGWWRPAGKVAGCLGTAGALAGIGLSGSRGGALDAMLVAGAVLVFIGSRNGRIRAKMRIPTATGCTKNLRVFGALVLVALLCAAASGPMVVGAGPKPPAATDGAGQAAAPARPQGWLAALQRNDTVRERLFYWQVGAALVRERPWLGNGPGAVEMNYGRLKPDAARETRYLHNWPLMVAVEQGLPALVVFAAGLFLLFAPVAANLRTIHPATAACGIAAAAFWVDGLYQLSFNHREALQAAALLAGVAAGTLRPAIALGHSPDPCKPRRWSGRLAAALSLVPLAITATALVVPRTIFERNTDAARAALEEGDLAAALRLARRAQNAYPADYEPHQILADIRVAQGNPVAALSHLELASRHEPWRASISLRRASLLLQINRPEDALRIIDGALPYYPTHSQLHRRRAEILLALGRRPEALSAATLAVRHGYLDLEDNRRFLEQLRRESP